MRLLQTEVTKLKEILAQLLDDISISIPLDVRSEMQTSIDMPDVLSPGRTFMQPEECKGIYRSRSNNDSSSQIIRENSSSYHESQDSEFLENLSRSDWSAAVSVKLFYESSHEKIKMRIPMLDLDNLPGESSEEEVADAGSQGLLLKE